MPTFDYAAIFSPKRWTLYLSSKPLITSISQVQIIELIIGPEQLMVGIV